jgi:hypothetical protein
LTERIPIVGHYRGIGLHAYQPQSRIDATVIPEIDTVLAMEDPYQLFDWSKNVANCPESRELATNKVLVIWELSAENRAVRPNLDLDLVKAVSAGVDSWTWIDDATYSSLLDHPKPGVAVLRDPECRERLRRDKTDALNEARARCGNEPILVKSPMCR